MGHDQVLREALGELHPGIDLDERGYRRSDIVIGRTNNLTIVVDPSDCIVLVEQRNREKRRTTVTNVDALAALLRTAKRVVEDRSGP